MSARWRYIIQEAFAGLIRNPLITIAVVLSATVSLVLLGGALLLNKEVDLIGGEWYDKVEVSIFLCDGRECAAISEEQREGLRADLQNDPLVESVAFESKQQAFDEFVDAYANQPNLLAGLTPEALPESFRVKLVDPEQFASINSRFAAYPGVEDIVDQRETLEDIFLITNAVRFVALFATGVQLLVTALLTAVIIRLSMFARREQLSIMRLVGAGNWYIRTPFLLEGLVAGLAGGLIAMGVMWGGMTLARNWLLNTLGRLFPVIDASDALEVGLQVLPVGAGIALVASLFSLLFQEHSKAGA